MNTEYIEKELTFDFTGCLSVIKLDEPGTVTPHGMSFVDFVVEEEQRILLIEVKDILHSKATQKARLEFMEGLKSQKLIIESLVPKARDSYTFLHLMRRDIKEFLYIVILGIIEVDLLPALRDRLFSRLQKETDVPWKRQYVTDCIILTPETFDENFDYSVRRNV